MKQFLQRLFAAQPEPSAQSIGEVVLYRNGQVRTSEVRRIGETCWVAWYPGIEKLVLNSDGTAKDSSLHYTWTLNTPGPRSKKADQEWFAKNCRDWNVAD
jgi:hypothetical protein